MKFLQVLFSNGEAYNIPTESIAHPRAIYYANHDEGVQDKGVEVSEEWNKVYQSERTMALEDDGELYDWAANNMNWSDVKDDAVRVYLDDKKIDYSTEWTNAEMKVVKA